MLQRRGHQRVQAQAPESRSRGCAEAVAKAASGLGQEVGEREKMDRWMTCFGDSMSFSVKLMKRKSGCRMGVLRPMVGVERSLLASLSALLSRIPYTQFPPSLLALVPPAPGSTPAVLCARTLLVRPQLGKHKRGVVFLCWMPQQTEPRIGS